MQTTLTDMATRFRHALDQLDWRSMPNGFHKFPIGTCGDISDILAEFLRSQGVEGIEYVHGVFRGGKSHAWLEISGYVVDITADQFPDVSQSVIVAKKSPWHKEFKKKTRRRAGFIVKDDQPITSRLIIVYNAALKQLSLLSSN